MSIATLAGPGSGLSSLVTLVIDNTSAAEYAYLALKPVHPHITPVPISITCSGLIDAPGP